MAILAIPVAYRSINWLLLPKQDRKRKIPWQFIHIFFSAVGLVLLTVRQLERMHYASAYTVPTDVIIIHSVRWNVTPQLFTHKVVSPVAVAVVIVTTDLWQFILIVEIERWRWRKWFPDIILLQFCSFWVVVELWWPAFRHRKNFA